MSAGGNEPQEWRDGQARAREARALVAEQVAALLTERDMTGDRDLLSLRLRQLIDAERDGDREAVRAAVMEVSLAAAAWAVAIDLHQRWPPRSRLAA